MNASRSAAVENWSKLNGGITVKQFKEVLGGGKAKKKRKRSTSATKSPVTAEEDEEPEPKSPSEGLFSFFVGLTPNKSFCRDI